MLFYLKLFSSKMKCLEPRSIIVKNDYPYPAPHYRELGLYRTINVPCGHCQQCLQKRQNGFSQRVYRSMQTYKFAWFVTFTYRDSALPISVSLYRINFDSDTGELVSEGVVDSHRLVDSEMDTFVRGKLLSIRSSSRPRYLSSPIQFNLDGADFEYKYVFTFSLCRDDWRNWLKKSRIQYQRAFGKPLPDFKYLCCGEMGPKTCRPHFHCLFLSQDASFSEALDWILAKWQVAFGYTQKKRVNYTNDDGSDGAYAVSRYISKYISKGKFECDSVKCKFAEKGRLCASMNLGAEDFPGPLLSWYFAFDLYGRYDPNTLVLQRTKTRLTDSQIIDVCDAINRRLFFTFPNGKTFAFSPYYRDKLFTYYAQKPQSCGGDYLRYPSGSRKKVRYYVSFLASERLQDVLDADYNKRLSRALEGIPDDEKSAAIEDIQYRERIMLQNRELDTEKALESFYSNSIF